MSAQQELPRPPRWPYSVLRKLLHEPYLEELLGDVEERFHENLQRHSIKKARRLYYLDTLTLLRPLFFKNLTGEYHLNTYGMFQTYFKIGIRNILKYKLFSLINIFGLAAAMSVCMFIILLLVDQKSYDNFHENDHLLYRIVGQAEPESNPYATTAFATGEELAKSYGFVDKSASLRRGLGGEATYKEKSIELRGYFASEAFLQCLKFPLVTGDPNFALMQPNGLVITKSKAQQLFGDEDPMGKVIQFHDRGLNILEDEGSTPPVDWGFFTITGIIEDDGYQSHLKFDALASYASLPALYQAGRITDLSKKWNAYWSSYAYVLLKEGIPAETLKAGLLDFSKQKYGDLPELENYAFSAQNIRDITPGPMMNNEPSFRLPMLLYYILAILAAIILAMASINYTSLSIARSLNRLKEIGVRKVNGASRKSLIWQFLTESTITALMAMLLGLVLLYIMRQSFLSLWANQFLDLKLEWTPSTFLFFMLFGLLTGIVAGLYPSIVLARKLPIEALKNQANPTKQKLGMQKVLNAGQLVFSLLFIVSSMVVYNQFKHYQDFDYGFNTKNILNIPLQGNNWQKLKTEMERVSGVYLISACEYLPASGTTDHMELADNERADEFINLQVIRVNETFLDNLALDLVAGTSIAASDQGNQFVVINESAALKLGYAQPSDAIGTFWKTRHGSEVKVKGVVTDFRSTLLINGHATRPAALWYDAGAFNYLNVRVSGNHQQETLNKLGLVWKSIDPKHPFIYEYYDQELANTNLFMLDIVTIVGYLAFLAIVIACLGLLGIATYATQRRAKEVGIRKVLGAKEWQVFLSLAASFLKLLIFAVCIASPLSYVANTFWLDNLPNRVDFTFSTVALGAGTLLLLGVFTIGTQTWRIARLNPVESLKDE